MARLFANIDGVAAFGSVANRLMGWPTAICYPFAQR